jgi:SAM-dependent methyltransferase
MDFYSMYADDFSKSRFRIWSHVKTFLDKLPPYSTVLDLGSGNGKNMTYRADLLYTGLEQSPALCDICVSRGLNVVQGDASQKLPFADNTFNAIIMIAVIHHIDPKNHYDVLKEVSRVLKPGGTCLITNWAVEQPSDSKRSFHVGLNEVIWKGKDSQPLPYWIMDKSLAEAFAEQKIPHLVCERMIWEAGNWEFHYRKSAVTISVPGV